MWRCVDLVWADVSEELIASIFRVEKSASEEPAWTFMLVPRSLIFLPWRWTWYVPPKRRFIRDLHIATSQKTALFIDLFCTQFNLGLLVVLREKRMGLCTVQIWAGFRRHMLLPSSVSYWVFMHIYGFGLVYTSLFTGPYRTRNPIVPSVGLMEPYSIYTRTLSLPISALKMETICTSVTSQHSTSTRYRDQRAKPISKAWH
jgi:hypothetical protein